MQNFKRLATITLLLAFSVQGLIVHAASGDIVEEFEVEPGGTFYLESDAGPVSVESWDRNTVRVEISNPDNFEIDLRKDGNDVVVEAESERGFLRFGRTRISFEIGVPSEYNVDVDTGGGRIEIGTIQGRVIADTSGGAIVVERVTGGPTRLDTSGGRISVESAEGDVEADTSGGTIEIGDVDGSVVADTSGGDIRIGDVTGDITADTSGGDIEVGESGGRVYLDTSGGSIRAGWAIGPITASTSGGNIRLAGSQESVEADTSGGNIVIERSEGPVDADTSGGSITISQASSAVRADTAGGRIEAELAGSGASGVGSVDLETAGGDVRLRLPSNYSATVQAYLEVSRRARGDYRIYTDFPLAISDDDNRIRGTGDINGGGVRISLETRDSDIFIESIDN